METVSIETYEASSQFLAECRVESACQRTQYSRRAKTGGSLAAKVCHMLKTMLLLNRANDVMASTKPHWKSTKEAGIAEERGCQMTQTVRDFVWGTLQCANTRDRNLSMAWCKFFPSINLKEASDISFCTV